MRSQCGECGERRSVEKLGGKEDSVGPGVIQCRKVRG